MFKKTLLISLSILYVNALNLQKARRDPNGQYDDQDKVLDNSYTGEEQQFDKSEQAEVPRPTNHPDPVYENHEYDVAAEPTHGPGGPAHHDDTMMHPPHDYDSRFDNFGPEVSHAFNIMKHDYKHTMQNLQHLLISAYFAGQWHKSHSESQVNHEYQYPSTSPSPDENYQKEMNFAKDIVNDQQDQPQQDDKKDPVDQQYSSEASDPDAKYDGHHSPDEHHHNGHHYPDEHYHHHDGHYYPDEHHHHHDGHYYPDEHHHHHDGHHHPHEHPAYDLAKKIVTSNADLQALAEKLIGHFSAIEELIPNVVDSAYNAGLTGSLPEQEDHSSPHTQDHQNYDAVSHGGDQQYNEPEQHVDTETEGPVVNDGQHDYENTQHVSP